MGRRTSSARAALYSPPVPASRRTLLRRIRIAILPCSIPLPSGGSGFLFTKQTNPNHPTRAGRALCSIRSRALPGASDTFHGFTPDGIVVDYLAGNIAVVGWRELRTGQLRALLRIAEAEAKAEPARRLRLAVREARKAVKDPAEALALELALSLMRQAGVDCPPRDARRTARAVARVAARVAARATKGAS